ncbi:hypothetical protein VP501E541_P0066 [Vibrio phage 501E54-1]|nr:hypothetical protein VP501E541_P0066 [Vibrio phage 501E54-1]
MQYHYATIGEGVEGYYTNREGKQPEGTIEVSAPPLFDWVLDTDGTFKKVLPDVNSLFLLESTILTEEYETNLDGLLKAYTSAIAWDGSSETEKVFSIRKEMQTLRDKYNLDFNNLTNKHYGV